MGFKKWADFLWPIGATVLTLLVMPLAIEQYPEFFKENRWPLPISVAVVAACWILPFCLHERAKGIMRWATVKGWMGIGLVALILILSVVAIIYGSTELFRFHTTHLAGVLNKKERKPEAPEQKVEPPPVTAPNVKPAPFTKHVEHPTGYLQFDKPQVTGPPYNTISPGKQFGMNFRSRNGSPERILRSFGMTAAYILPATDESDKVALDRFANNLKSARKKYASGEIKGPEVAAGTNGVWGTLLLHLSEGLTPDEAEGIISKHLRIYYVSWLAWTDLQNRMDWSDKCEWLQIPDGPGPYSGELVWHFCSPPSRASIQPPNQHPKPGCILYLS